MIKRFALFLLSVLAFQMAFSADEDVKVDSVRAVGDEAEVYLMSNTCTWLSSGCVSMYDSYLSPLLYKGSSLSVGHERLNEKKSKPALMLCTI